MRIIKRTILFLLLIVIAIIGYLNFDSMKASEDITWGVGFSELQAQRLGLDWRKVYLGMLTDFDFERVRLSSYWNEIEKEQGVYNFTNLDFMVSEATKNGRQIMIVLGRRQPRWPECFIPEWAMEVSLAEQDAFVLTYIQKVVERYRDNEAIIAWQVENEYFLDAFGVCPDYEKSGIDKEIDLVKSLDSRPVALTDSGELSFWYPTASRADILGTTMYRRVFNPVFQYATYPHRPIYYSKLGKLVQSLAGFDRQIISELQMEPWSRGGMLEEDSTEENYKTFSPENFVENIEYAKGSGIDEIYVWGVEWWYYMKDARGIDTFWEQGKDAFRID